MNGARSVPPANEDEQPDEEIEQRGDAQIILDGGRVLLGGGNDGRFEGAVIAAEAVLDFGPGNDAEQDASNIGGATNGYATNGLDNVALFDAGFGCGRVWDDVPGGNARRGVHPGDAIVGEDEAGALLEIQKGENDGCQRKKRQQYGPESHSQTIVHASTPVEPESEW